jgi:Bacterial protein of unknown function (DUF885)
MFICFAADPALHADSLDDLARDFWQWRAIEQPISSDDIPRIERPAGWVPNWSASAVADYQQQLLAFEARWKAMDSSTWPVPRQVDYRLIGSAIARVRWELELTRAWQRNPMFYADQTVGPYFDRLLQPPPFGAERSREIVAALASIPATLEEGKKNLTQPAAPFARLAIDALAHIHSDLLQSVRELKPFLDKSIPAGELDAAAEHAATALDSYREWLQRRLPTMSQETAVGRESYVFFLKNVALLPFSPEQLLAMGRQEWARAVASQTYEEHRNAGLPELPVFKDVAEELAHEEKDELAVRQFLQQKSILSVPSWMPHYRLLPIPAYMAPVADFGEDDDFTSPSRLKDNGTRYVAPPSPQLGYFMLTIAKDPRCLIVHEGVPGHYFQLALSRAQADAIRRHYYDSGANEGIGFYAEEMMLHSGLFDDSPRTPEIIWNFMRLRALRVEVDVKLALGEFTIEQAVQYLMKTVPMDPATAHDEASSFAYTPGQAISYEIGKLQIYQFLAEAQRQKSTAFNLQAFHDFLWQNGNVPIMLQEWEYLGKKDDLERLERLR